MQAKRVLVVDDQNFAAQVLKDMLERHGFIVDVAHDGFTALACALEASPDIVLLDMIMPGMDGVETCRRFKQESRLFSIPIIVVTAKKDKENLVSAFEAGAEDYLSKPVEDHELLARIKSNLIKKEALLLLERANQVKREALNQLEKKVRESELLLDITQAVTSTLNTREILQAVVDNIARNISVKRCSIARINLQEDSATVLASSDVPGIEGLKIRLDKYPEIREVVRTGQPLMIDDARSHPLLTDVREQIALLDFCTLFVLPVTYRSEVIGTLMLRTAREYTFADDEVRFCQMVANVSAAALKNAHLYEQARNESRELREATLRIEKELQEKAIYESLFEQASEGLMAITATGEAVFINSGGLEILGYRRDELPNPLIPGVVAGESFQFAVDTINRFFRGEEHLRRFDLFVTRMSGETRCISFSLGSGLLQGNYMVLSFTDVTEERQSRYSLEKANGHLQELARLKSAFITTATHELNTPVKILHGYCDMFRKLGIENLTQEQRECMDHAFESSRHLLELIATMLDLSRLEAGKMELSIEPRNILISIEKSFAILEPFGRHSGIDLIVIPPREELIALLDVEQIQRVLMNLIGNAIKYTPQGGHITIAAERVVHEIQISVSDSGPGIPEEFLPNIFDEFSQARSGPGPQQGSGLGLAICRKIIEAHHGSIWAESSDKGSRFTFSLPAWFS
jgi:PAS domain S-box-containing protein